MTRDGRHLMGRIHNRIDYTPASHDKTAHRTGFSDRGEILRKSGPAGKRCCPYWRPKGLVAYAWLPLLLCCNGLATLLLTVADALNTMLHFVPPN